MNRLCIKCKKETINVYQTVCDACQKQEKKKETIGFILFCLGILAIFVTVRIVWAKIVYKDARCAWAECRINVDPK